MCQSGEQGLFFSIKGSSCGVMVPFQMWEDDTTVTQLFDSRAVMVYGEWRDEPSYHDPLFRVYERLHSTLFLSHLEKNVS